MTTTNTSSTNSFSQAKLETSYTRLVASGLAMQDSPEPLVAIHPSEEFPGSFDVMAHLFIPDDSTNPALDSNLDEVSTINTEAGLLNVRVINITYDVPASQPQVTTYSLWQMKFNYLVLGTQAQAIQVQCVIGDPRTARGTVTTISKT